MAELCFNTFNRSAWFGVDPELPRQVRAAAAAGFGSVSFDVFSIQRQLADGGSLEAVAALLDERGLRCPELVCLMLGGDLGDAPTQLSALEPAARALRPDWVLTNIEAPLGDPRTAEELRVSEARVGDWGARLALEYTPFMAMACMRDALAWIEEAKLERAAVLVDSWHFFHGADDWKDLDSLRLEQLAYVQFDDHPPLQSDDLRSESITRRALPGDGVLDLTRFCNVLRRKGFDGLVSVEVISDALRARDVESEARETFEKTAPFWPPA